MRANDEDLEVSLRRLAASRIDEEAWTLVYRQLWPLIYSTVYRSVSGNHAMAEDIAQEVFVRVARYARFENLQDAKSFRSYLLTIARNEVVREFTSSSRMASVAESKSIESMSEDGGESVPDTVSQQEQADVLLLLQDETEQLGKEDRVLLGLMIEGYTIGEISKEIGLSYSNTAVRIHRLRKRLAEGPLGEGLRNRR